MNLRPQSDRDSNRAAFLAWQCRARQAAMRQRHGRPDGAAQPEVELPGAPGPHHKILTVLCRRPEQSQTPELVHLAKRNADPAERRDAAVRFLSAGYYQTWRNFTDTVTASFAPGSPFAHQIAECGACRLLYDALGHRFKITCRAARLGLEHPLRAATWWHNHLFNPSLHPQAEIIGFVPDWARSEAGTPSMRQG